MQRESYELFASIKEIRINLILTKGIGAKYFCVLILLARDHEISSKFLAKKTIQTVFKKPTRMCTA